MEFLKCFMDENQQAVMVEYKSVTENEKTPMIIKSFTLDKIIEREPMIAQFLEGDVVSIYYEYKWDHEIGEKNYGYKVEPLDVDISKWCERFVRDVCINELHEDLLKPPSIDEQVEDFIKEFFEDDEGDSNQDYLANFFDELEEEVNDEFNNKEAEQKDFLEDFFAELEDDASSNKE